MHIHIIQHESFEAPGAYYVWAISRGHEVSFTRCWKGDVLPESMEGIDWLLIMGGPQSPDTTEAECPYFHSQKAYGGSPGSRSREKPGKGSGTGETLPYRGRTERPHNPCASTGICFRSLAWGYAGVDKGQRNSGIGWRLPQADCPLWTKGLWIPVPSGIYKKNRRWAHCSCTAGSGKSKTFSVYYDSRTDSGI